MGKTIRRIIMIILLIIFLGSAGVVLFTMYQYKENEKIYTQASEQFTAYASGAAGTDVDEGGQTSGTAAPQEGRTGETAPIVVDFAALKNVNEDVIGWIYCEGTVINYPVLHGRDNDFYLHHSYEGSYNASGSIFTDTNNATGFTDANTIIYGHHMNDQSMFATICYWEDQAYYEEHPVMWLLTPEQDYKIVLFSGYNTPARSDTYTIFPSLCKDMDEYLAKAMAQSDFVAGTEVPKAEHYVLLSTCAYVFDNARYVLHGYLQPVDSAGGVPF